jgi:hypothetical protein
MDAWDFDVATREMRLARQVAERIAGASADPAQLAALWADYEAASSHQALERLRDRVP